MPDHDAHDIIVLFSSRSRDAYAAEATARGETYTFTDARGLPRTWVKGEYAYLAPNAAGLLLARCNLKHRLVEEAGASSRPARRASSILSSKARRTASSSGRCASGNCRPTRPGRSARPSSLPFPPSAAA